MLENNYVITNTPYQVIHLLGKGAYGYVYKGLDL